MKISELKQIIKEEYASASKLYQFEGNIVIDPSIAFHKQIMSDIRAIEGITIVKDYVYEPIGGREDRDYATLDIKVDPSPFMAQGGVDQDVINSIIENIKKVKGVTSFKLKKGPFRIEL